MIQLILLLMGARPFRERWWLLCLFGATWMVLGAWLALDASDGYLRIAKEILGLLLVVQGLGYLVAAFFTRPRARSALRMRASLLLVLGLMVAVPLSATFRVPDHLLFGLAFLADGLLRIASAWVVRFPRWKLAVFAGSMELLLVVMLVSNWPFHHHYLLPICLGIFLVASGWALVRVGLQLRRLKLGEPITTLPLFFSRGWYKREPGMLPEVHDRDYSPSVPMTLYVWTPRGSATDPLRRPLVDRYIAAVDGHGVISTGHSALEMQPDLYISHYPGVEIDHSPDDFAKMLRAGGENDIPGRWIANHTVEVADWCEPDAQVVFHHYDPIALSAFWNIYRQDTTYNLTSRSCSTVTSLAIETGVEGVLGRYFTPWTFLVLLFDPDVWLAASLRRRSVTMAWTPGLVLDYARLLHVVIARQDRRWLPRLARFLSGVYHARRVTT